MTAPFSIIIPTLNAQEDLPETLDSLLPGLAAGLIAEVIISDGGSEDETLTIAEASGATIIPGERGRGGQLKRGAAQAKGEWLLFLHADTHLPEVWPGALGTHIAKSQDAAAFRLAFRSTALMARVTAGWANFRSHIFGMPYGDQALLIHRAHYQQIGGYSDIPLMEDVEIARRLKGNLVLLSETVTTSADRYARQGWGARGAKNLILLSRFLLGASPADLARSYHKR